MNYDFRLGFVVCFHFNSIKISNLNQGGVYKRNKTRLHCAYRNSNPTGWSPSHDDLTFYSQVCPRCLIFLLMYLKFNFHKASGIILCFRWCLWLLRQFVKCWLCFPNLDQHGKIISRKELEKILAKEKTEQLEVINSELNLLYYLFCQSFSFFHNEIFFSMLHCWMMRYL